MLTRSRLAVERVKFFQKAAQENDGQAFDMEKMQNSISQFVHQYDEDYDSVKKTRRPGRPPSAREDLLKMKVEALEKEYQHGFCALTPVSVPLPH